MPSPRPGIPPRIFRLLTFVPMLLCILCCLFFWRKLQGITLQELLEFTPSNLFLATLVIWGLYAVKSFTIVFPLMLLYLVSGHLFSPWIALLVNLVGLFFSTSLPYWLGRLASVSVDAAFLKKYPQAAQLINNQKTNAFALSYFLRVVNLLPGDVVSMLLGAARLPYRPYLGGSLLGMFPAMAAATFLGSSVTDPRSPQFFAAAIGTVLLTVLPMLYARHRHRREQ
ncbi:MAG: TVP38/TMEM64 family protein [Eubacteriales bacterium]|jgi:uncharacterized membrane protein YdjX (TVP38/TMEM64 family)